MSRCCKFLGFVHHCLLCSYVENMQSSSNKNLFKVVLIVGFGYGGIHTIRNTPMYIALRDENLSLLF